MAKDLTEALAALTEAASGKTSRVDKSLPDPRIPPAIPARTGSSKPILAQGMSGTGFELAAEKTIATSDGLFTIYFPKTIKATVSGAIDGVQTTSVVTVGVIKEEAASG